ncbi:FAD/NAD-P-binding domain-containing protein [Mycena maculata]|uniref:FAD/NAD-P-binding domain-containing protein n=1 Tax=Mycena maculata TaxID=230809 RepID=A0AAD7HWT2_9AGAR|nr:FAD/NAD-P-binding domain-containing protein [Mycena maculata]
MSLPAHPISVLIVGAGPCGMAAALSLHHQGIQDVVTVDSLLAGENSSRAMFIQAATLEALNSVGCLDKLLKAGDKVPRLVFRDGASCLISVDFSLLQPYTNCPFGLVLPQSDTEAGMLETLGERGIKVLRPYKVVSLRSSDKEQTIDVGFESGEIVQAKYVIGADGAHSVVRQETGISFNDPDGDEEHDYGNLSQLVLGDVTFSSPPQFPPPASKVLGSLSDGNFVLLAPFPASVSPDPDRLVYRFASSVPTEDGTAPHAPSTEYLQSLLNRCAPPAVSSYPAVNPHPVHIEKTYWSSRYRTRSAIAERAFARLGDQRESGVVLLIGDAAHIHSPVGGQGMSLGIRDAISLGPALRAHINLAVQEQGASSDQDRLLADWAASRHGRALAVIALTKGALGIIASSRMVWRRWFGFTILRLLGSFKFIQRMVAYRLSGLAEI